MHSKHAAPDIPPNTAESVIYHDILSRRVHVLFQTPFQHTTSTGHVNGPDLSDEMNATLHP